MAPSVKRRSRLLLLKTRLPGALGATNLGHEGPCADNVEGGHAKETLGVVHAFLLQHLVFVCVQVRECAIVRRE